jgi:CIC family chloride channel protein
VDARLIDWFRRFAGRDVLSGDHLTILLAGVVGLVTGVGAAFFGTLIEFFTDHTFGLAAETRLDPAASWWLWTLVIVISPPIGMLVVAWVTRTFAPEAMGLGMPEVIAAVARHDGVIRPRAAVVKTLASGISIGMGGSVGREGPIVQIGSAVGSAAGQLMRLSAKNIKVLVAAGAAAGISATFNAPLAGVVFASEIILGSFAVESLTPIVLASVIADVVQQHIGEHRFDPAFRDLEFQFAGAWAQLPSYLLLGLVAGLAAAGFIKVLYGLQDITEKWIPDWRKRALALGAIVGLVGAFYPVPSPASSHDAQAESRMMLPPIMGVGYPVVDHALHMTIEGNKTKSADEEFAFFSGLFRTAPEKAVIVPRDRLLMELLWLAPLVLLKPVMTGLTIAGGGSGGVFAPSLFLGATLGGTFGLLANLVLPGYSPAPGVYAIVGMAAVVAGTTHGILSAILIVYEMTDQYEIILPIMAAAGVSTVVTKMLETDSIYYKKLSRRGEFISRGHDLHLLDHVMVRDVMLRNFPSLKPGDNAAQIIKIARAHPEIESLPVLDAGGKFVGIIRAEDLHRILDSDLAPELVYAEDIALRAPLSVLPSANLIEAMRDFGARDVETLPVEVGVGENRQLVGLLLRTDVMRRYRQEMLRRH